MENEVESEEAEGDDSDDDDDDDAAGSFGPLNADGLVVPDEDEDEDEDEDTFDGNDNVLDFDFDFDLDFFDCDQWMVSKSDHWVTCSNFEIWYVGENVWHYVCVDVDGQVMMPDDCHVYGNVWMYVVDLVCHDHDHAIAWRDDWTMTVLYDSQCYCECHDGVMCRCLP